MATKTSLLQSFTPSDLSGRRTLVTGGGRGIGLAIARRLTDGGARVAIADVDV
jgi:3-hydroxybutyrate dehydrogenase